MGPWTHPSPHPKWHLDRFSHFFRAHNCNRQTDRQTTLLSVTVGHIHIHSTAMRPNYAMLPNYIRMKQPGPLSYVNRNSQERCSFAEADAPTIRLVATPSRLHSAHLHSSPPRFLQVGCPSCHPANSVKILKARCT